MSPNSVFVIAEIGSVHDGSFGNAMCLIDVAADCGADAVKFQTHISEAETLRDAPMPHYFKGEPRYEYFQRTAFTPSQWVELKERADELGVLFLSSPFSNEAVDLLEEIGVEAYKIPSGEITNHPLIRKAAETGKAVLLSSGMSDWGELDAAVKVVEEVAAGIDRSGDKAEIHPVLASPLTVFQCTSEYPCSYERVGLNVMEEMKERYDCPVGLSDHTSTIYAPIVAVSRGALVIEKHLTFSRRMYGSDAKNSLEPGDFKRMVEGIRAAEKMLTGQVDKSNSEPFSEMKRIFEKSVVSLAAIPSGTRITKEMLGIKKPGGGIAPGEIDRVVGAKALSDIAADTQLEWTGLEVES